MECQHHNLCGDYCDTEAERAAGLCSSCLEAEQADEHRQHLTVKLGEALDALDRAKAAGDVPLMPVYAALEQAARALVGLQ